MAEDPMEPYKRADRKFRKSAEAASRRFRAKVQYACDKARIEPCRLADEIEQAKAQFRAELEEARLNLTGKMRRIAPLRPPLDAHDDLQEFRDAASAIPGRKVEHEVELCRAIKVRRGWRDPRLRGRDHRRKRPPRDLGGEMAPVKPRPNPTPLMDGAEAPIE